MTLRTAWLAVALASSGVAVHAQEPAAIDKAKAQVEQQAFPAAEKTLRDALLRSPQDVPARFLLARVLAWQGRPAEALPFYDSLLADEPDNVDYLLGYGQALLWADRPRDALVPLRRGLALRPDYAELHALERQAQAALGSPPPGAPPRSSAGEPRAATAMRSTVGLSHRDEALDGDRAGWRAQRLDYAWQDGNERHLGATLVRESRFGLVDTGVELRGGMQLAREWSIHGEVGLFPGADIQPEWFTDVRLQRPLARAGDATLLGSASLRRTRYRDASVDRLALGGELYRGAWRLGYTFNLTRVDGGSLAGHDLALDRYYGDSSFVGLRIGTGREDVRLPAGVVASGVDAVALLGRHWWTPDWAVEWGVGHVVQSDLYDRRWWTLGLRRAF